MGARFVDRETNMSEVEVRPQREETRTDIMHSHSRDEHMPISHDSLSSHETDIVGGSPLRPHVTNIMSQLDLPLFMQEEDLNKILFERLLQLPKGRYPDESDSDSHDNRRPHDEQRHSGRRRHYHDRGGRPPDRENDQERGYPGRKTPR